MQDENGLLLSGMGFALSDKSRREAEDSVTQQAIKSWQARAQSAAVGLGFGGWRPGHITVQTGDAGRAYPVMRAQAMSVSGGSSPVAVEAGTTEVSVTVSGEAILDSGQGSDALGLHSRIRVPELGSLVFSPAYPREDR